MGFSLGRIFSILPERRKCSVIPFRQKGQKRQRAPAVIIGAIPQAVASPELALKAPAATLAGEAFAAELESSALPEPPPAEPLTAEAPTSPVPAEDRDADGDASPNQEPVLCVCNPVASQWQIRVPTSSATEPELPPVPTTSLPGEDEGAGTLAAPGPAVEADAGLPPKDGDLAPPHDARHRDPPAEPAADAPPGGGREAGACPTAGLSRLGVASPDTGGPPDPDRLSQVSPAQPTPAAPLTVSFAASSGLPEGKSVNLSSRTAEALPRRDEAAGAKDTAAASVVAAPLPGDRPDKGEDLPSSGAGKILQPSANEAVAEFRQTEASPAAPAPTVLRPSPYPAPPVGLASNGRAPALPLAVSPVSSHSEAPVVRVPSGVDPAPAPAVPLVSPYPAARLSRVPTGLAPARPPSPVDGSSEQDDAFRARIAYIVSIPQARSEPELNLLPRQGASANMSDSDPNLSNSRGAAQGFDVGPPQGQSVHDPAPAVGYDLPAKLEMPLSRHAPLQPKEPQPAHPQAERMPVPPPVPASSEGALPAAQPTAVAPRDVAIAAPVITVPAAAERGGTKAIRHQMASERLAGPGNSASSRPEPQAAASGETQRQSPETDLAPDLPVAHDPPPSAPVLSEPRVAPDQARTPAHPAPQAPARAAAEAQSGEEDAVEVVLQPDELGRVKMTVAHDGGHVRVLVQADRTDTLDMMRRNSGDLGVEMRQAGFSGASLSFGGREGQPPPRARAALEAESTDVQPPTAATSRSATGLDLRI
ncbi:flagellar hook-length control protein FliK [Cereibacter sphaeroides]|uniref:flagellar hook-length control protein FliK n=1 Tax=Cereibacter sphaeroides TaxID=1063 RepID=UPI002E267596